MITFFDQYRFLEGFNRIPAHLWQVNCTDWYDPLIMYSIAVAYEFKYYCEIGQAEGYTSWYLGVAAKQFGGRYFGVDVVDTWNRHHEPFGYSLSRYFEGERVPAKFLQADTLALKSFPSFAEGGLDIIDMAFVDGQHDTDHIMHEVYTLLLPKMRRDGWGFICLDDIIDQGAQGAWALIQQDQQFEHLTIHPNGGFGILRYKG